MLRSIAAAVPLSLPSGMCSHRLKSSRARTAPLSGAIERGSGAGSRHMPMTADPHARLAEFLSIGDSKQNLPGVKIRDAATMLVIDRTGRTPKVLLGRRHHGHKFMPGKYVFPGGRVELADRRLSAATPLDKRVEARLMQEVRYPSAEKSRGFPLAAIREVFEETGLILGTRMDQPLATFPRKRGKGEGPRHAPSDEWAKFAGSG